jgi:Tubulin-tyrosine ligase family
MKLKRKLPQFNRDHKLNSRDLSSAQMWCRVRTLCKQLIDELTAHHPQTVINGVNNLWIVKPGGLSRGRKIRLFSDLQEIVEYAEIDWSLISNGGVQKERPTDSIPCVPKRSG